MDADGKKKSDIAKREEETLMFWEENGIFKKSLEKDSPAGEFVFYDGPPFATGMPHYGHILAGIIKDVIPRYRTMRGYHVRRRWGWDCHGLPLENLVEKELGLKTKKDIEKLGVDVFNKKARESVLRYADDWKKIVPRTGRFVDMARDYRTMDMTYTESVWWVFKTLHEKGLVYEGSKAMHLCPRCETTLSNFEVSQGYKEITDLAATVKFPLSDEPGVYLLAWTTTPWTLPGNAALAVNPDIIYLEAETVGGERVILARKRAEAVLKAEYKIVRELAGEELVGMRYNPPFPYYGEELNHEENKNNWQVYAADFVAADEGTGIVHVAPAFGEDDMKVGEKHDLSFIRHVSEDGTFKREVLDFPLMPVKPKEAPTATDAAIIARLDEKGLLFSSEEVTHAYPHCWRCDTPLLNYARNSWFVNVSEIRGDLVRENEKIGWVPPDVRTGRFGKWLSDARDWAVSRSRFWGAPIPAWKCGACERVAVIGSIEELLEKSVRSGNTYYIMRHGEALNNVKGVMSSALDWAYPLSIKGKLQVKKAAAHLKKKKIDIIVSSPIARTKETALLVAEAVGYPKDAIVFAPGLQELNAGDFEGKSIDEYRGYFSSLKEHFTKTPPGGENLSDVKARVTGFLYDLDSRHAGKNVLIVSHSGPLWMLAAGARGAMPDEAVAMHGVPHRTVQDEAQFIRTAEVRELAFTPIPHNRSFEFDLHRPYIDEVRLRCECGGEMRRVPEVFDCWFESGSMPYGEHHYPFDSAQGKPFDPAQDKGFPADFIAEGLDQTRGWFYSLLVLSVALFGKSAYKNVIANGLVLAEDGRKMSKKLKNYPDPGAVIGRYGADSLRLYLLSSPVVRGEDLNFSEKGVNDVRNKTVTRLWNAALFYEMYAGDGPRGKALFFQGQSSKHILDRWVTVRLAELINQVTDALERYELDRAARPLAQFVDDLSTWYVRRSRERFKGEDAEDKAHAVRTMRFVLGEFSKVAAPFMPFLAEAVYRKVAGEEGLESVHLEDWPRRERHVPVWPNPMALFHRIFRTHDGFRILSQMDEVRAVVRAGLDARTRAGIKVRQPVALLKIKNRKSKLKNNKALLALVRDEVNAKEVAFDDSIGNEVEIDTTITPELAKEGELRELVRFVQDLRKKEGFLPGEEAVLTVEANDKGKAFIEEFEALIKKAAALRGIKAGGVRSGRTLEVGAMKFSFALEKDG